MDENRINLIFLIDTSGSMRDQKIQSVNAALAECMEVLRNYQSAHARKIRLGFISFHEKMEKARWSEQCVAPAFTVQANADGFYGITSFQCLYHGLYSFLRTGDVKGALYFVLITDGKISETREEYDEAFEKAYSLRRFRDAKRYAAIVALEEGKAMLGKPSDNDILQFVSGNDAKKRFHLDRLSEELTKMDFFLDRGLGDSPYESDFIASIFGD